MMTPEKKANGYPIFASFILSGIPSQRHDSRPHAPAGRTFVVTKTTKTLSTPLPPLPRRHGGRGGPQTPAFLDSSASNLIQSSTYAAMVTGQSARSASAWAMM
jgi:hypothetical protein